MIALVGEYSQIDLFGTTINLCSNINTSSIPNEIIIGDNFYRILKYLPTMLHNYNFINHTNYQITENKPYSLDNIKRKKIVEINDIEVTDKNSFVEQQLGSSSIVEHFNNNNQRIILVDDEEDVLFTYKIFLEDHGYEVTAFTDPSFAMNYIGNIPNFKNLLIILDILLKKFEWLSNTSANKIYRSNN